MSFSEFFYKATRHQPFRYQTHLGESPLESRVIRVPTGAGKTEAAILPWLWKTEIDSANTPKRLIVFTPMRALVTQTTSRIQRWLENLGMGDRINLVELLGEHPELRQRNRQWTEFPECPTIVVGTVDLLLSAALNRGYAMSRFRWPVAFGLLNNSALWVVDEVQLMGPATTTFSQLEHFRKTLGTISPVFTWWMSATVEPAWLTTVDYLQPPPVTPKDLTQVVEDLGIKFTAKKSLRQGKILNADLIYETHRGGLTLVVVNTVKAARDLYRSLVSPPIAGKKKSSAKPPTGLPEIYLIHSRFRPIDRKVRMEKLIEADEVLRPGSQNAGKYPFGAIVVATQVAEAGLDVSAQTMVTELAPWPSLVQRFGRLNRTGREPAAQAIWIDVKEPAPYESGELKISREIIKTLEDVGPQSLAPIELPPVERQVSVIRQHDFLGLFSTDKDLAGGFTDISNYIRDSSDRDVYLGWRDFKASPNTTPQQSELESYELCPVSIGEAKAFRSGGSLLWEWNDETGSWEPRSSNDLVPGMTLLCAASNGGYSPDTGWTGDKADRPGLASEPAYLPKDSAKTDETSLNDWRELHLHLYDVETAAGAICRSLALDSSTSNSLILAAHWHDIGKALPEWQEAAKRAIQKRKLPYREGVWAKFPAKSGTFHPGFRHEEASALYAMQCLSNGDPGWTPLAVYLIACHHGKVRATLGTFGVKSLREFKNPSLHLPGFIDVPVALDPAPLSFSAPGEYDAASCRMKIDGPSWSSLVASLAGTEDGEVTGNSPIGPFRLAFLEALIVAADIRASRNPGDITDV
jgi:CRISPR-associated endonuclease/helicase Cas3